MYHTHYITIILVTDAEEYQAEDEKVTAYNELESYAYNLHNTLWVSKRLELFENN